MIAFALGLGLIGIAGVAVVARKLMRRGIHCWIVPCILRSFGRRRNQPVHMLLCIADHYEPGLNDASRELADARVALWVEQYPQRLGAFRDSDGRVPQHSFFYPIDQYEPAHVDAIAGLCRAGFGEIEVHLHHSGDNSTNLRSTLLAHREAMYQRHGVGARHRETGELVYGFIHGDWALDNSLPNGRCCGVNDELNILRETGCYCDFTLPSYPSAAQTRKINSIYYATDDPREPKSHDTGVDVGTGEVPPNSLMLIQGPLVLNWTRRKWGLLPRFENGCIQGNQAPSIQRLDAWLNARVQVPGRPDWYFVKLHTHGANEANHSALLGTAGVEFHRALAQRAKNDPNFRYHYVTAREMYNLAKAAEAGWKGSVAEARDYEILWDGVAPKFASDDMAVSNFSSETRSEPLIETA